MKFCATLIVMVMICLFGKSSGKADEFVLVDNGRSNAEIVIETDALATVRYAAEELREYVNKISGVNLTIVEIGPNAAVPADGKPRVFVGENAFTRTLGLDIGSLKSDGFFVRATPNALVLAGLDEPVPYVENPNPTGRYEQGFNQDLKLCAIGQTGSLFAVYHFLRQYCGVMWIWPGELGEVVPKSQRISLPLSDYTVEPDFELRMYYSFSFGRDPVAAKWYRRAGFGSPSDPMHPNHSAHLIYQRKSNHENHPEWFALQSDERHPVALCWSEPSLIDEWTRLAKEYFTKHPEAMLFSVMPEDENTICECPRCQANIDWSPPHIGPDSPIGGNQLMTNLIWPVVNEVARRIAPEFPDKKIGNCAYMLYLAPPHSVPKLEPNVLVMFCAQTPMLYPAGVYGPEIRKFEQAWLNKGGVFSTWDYLNHHGYSWGVSAIHTPIVVPNMIGERYKRLKGLSRGGFFQADNVKNRGVSAPLSHYGMDHVNWYVLGKLSWDLSLDVNELLDEYTEKFYGPAAALMRRFWQIQEDRWRNRQDMVVWPGGLLFRWNHVYTPRVMREMFGALDEAKREAAGADAPAYLQRIEIIAGEYDILRSCFVDEWAGYPADSIVPNGSFEEVVAGMPVGWHYDDRARVVDDVSLSGQRSLRLDGVNAYALSDVIKLNPERQYMVSVWFKTEGNGNPDVEAACPKLTVYGIPDGDAKPAGRTEAVPGRVRGASQRGSTIASPAVDGWQRMYVIASMEYAQIRLHGAQGYTCWYDDVTIEELPEDWRRKAIGYPSYPD